MKPPEIHFSSKVLYPQRGPERGDFRISGGEGPRLSWDVGWTKSEVDLATGRTQRPVVGLDVWHLNGRGINALEWEGRSLRQSDLLRVFSKIKIKNNKRTERTYRV